MICHIFLANKLLKEIDHAIRTGFMLDLFNNDELDELMNHRLMAMECRTISPRIPIPEKRTGLEKEDII